MNIPQEIKIFLNNIDKKKIFLKIQNIFNKWSSLVGS